MSAIGLSQKQKSLILNYQFMSTRIPGTRQVRRSINHLVFSSRVIYGLPVFMTITPSERHSALMIRLSRYRRNDPAILFGSPEFAPWAGFNTPSLEAKVDNDSNGDVEFDVPNYDLRKLMTARDSLCGVDAYNIAVRVVAAHLYGL